MGIGAFESDTSYRLAVEAARYWLVECHLRTNQLPDKSVRFIYANGPNGIDWGNPPGSELLPEQCPLRGKRIRVTFEVEDG